MPVLRRDIEARFDRDLRPIQRLQCYRGVSEDKAIGRFDEGLQRLYTEFSKGQHEDWQTVHANLMGLDFLRPGPLMRALECDRPCVLLPRVWSRDKVGALVDPGMNVKKRIR